MSISRLQEHVWESLGARRSLAGRARVYRITRRIVARWPDDGEGTEVSTKAVKAEEQKEYGMGIILSLILGSLIQAVVNILVQWWTKNHTNRLLMAGYKKEMLSAGD